MYRTLIASGALAVCLASSGTTVMAAQTDGQLLPSVLTIHIKNFKFNPTPVKIHAGDRVTFVNDDDEAHTATADDKSFDSEGLDTSGAWDGYGGVTAVFADKICSVAFMRGNLN